MSFGVTKVLLDSTYILPSFGIEVKELSNTDIAALREAKLENKVDFYCSTISWVEVIGKVGSELWKYGLDISVEEVELAIRSLLESGFYKWIEPSVSAVALALKLRILGSKDNIDNLLYAISIENDMLFLTMDKKFKEFLLQHGYKVDKVLDHKELFRKL